MAKIFLTGEIGGWGANSEDLKWQLGNVPEGEDIELIIDSPGGSVLEANSIMNMLLVAKNDHKIVGKVMGQCMSAATYILQACSERLIADNAVFMIHEVSVNAMGRMTEKDINRLAEVVRVFNESVLTSLSKSGRDIEDIRSKYFDGKDHFMTPQEAIDAGFVDSILDFSFETKNLSVLNSAGDAESRFLILNQVYDMSKEKVDNVENTDETPIEATNNDELLASFKSRMEEAQNQRDELESQLNDEKQAFKELQAKYDTLATDFANVTSAAEKAKVEASFEIQKLKDTAAKDKQVYDVKNVIMGHFARAGVRKGEDEISRYAKAFLAQHKIQDQDGVYAVMDVVENVVSDLAFEACVMQFVEKNYRPARGNGFTTKQPANTGSSFAAIDKQNKIEAWAKALSAKRIPYGSNAAYKMLNEFGLTQDDIK